MTPPIIQSIKLPATPEELYRTMLDSKLHTAMTGMPAKSSNKVGAKWSAFGGTVSGHNLMLVPGKMIVQAWRSVHFKKTDPNSVMVMTFTKVTGGARIDLVHVNVSAQDHKEVTQGWKKYYWGPWRAYLKKKK